MNDDSILKQIFRRLTDDFFKVLFFLVRQFYKFINCCIHFGEIVIYLSVISLIVHYSGIINTVPNDYKHLFSIEGVLVIGFILTSITTLYKIMFRTDYAIVTLSRDLKEIKKEIKLFRKSTGSKDSKYTNFG